MTAKRAIPEFLDSYADGDDPSYFEVQVWVVSVTDGDTVRVIFDGEIEHVKVRLAGLDAPETDQEYGPESTALLETLALGKTLTLAVICTNRNPGCPGGTDCQCTDYYGRRVGILYESTWRDSINRQLIEAGLAYNWPSYGMLYGGDRAQRRARTNKVGVWARFGGEVRPWSHRHGGNLTPMEYMREKEEEEAQEKVKGPRAEAKRLAKEVERLRQRLEDVGIEE